MTPPTTPPQEPGKRKALALAITVHLALIGALLYGVSWKSSEPEAVEVELWSARPMAETAPPPPPPPPPEAKPEPKPEPKPQPKAEPKPEPKPPVKPDIAVKEEKKPKKPEPKPEPEPKKPEPKKPEPKPEPKKPEPKAEPRKPEPPQDHFKEMLEREERQRSATANAQRLAAQAEAEQRASASRRGLAEYVNRIKVKVRGNITMLPSIQGNPEAIFNVTQLPTGEVLGVSLKKSSGNPALDLAIERAIRNSSPLPLPADPALFKREIEIKYRPFD